MFKSGVMAKSLLMQVMNDPKKIEKEIKKLEEIELRQKDTLADILKGRTIQKMEAEAQVLCEEFRAEAERAKAEALQAKERAQEVEVKIRNKFAEITTKALSLEAREKALAEKEAQVEKRLKDSEAMLVEAGKKAGEANKDKMYWNDKVAELNDLLKKIGA